MSDDEFDVDAFAKDCADAWAVWNAGQFVEYIVLHEGTVIERIDASTADEALAKRQMRHGDMYVKVGS